jgi:surfactin synthase thioesterase subunit
MMQHQPTFQRVGRQQNALIDWAKGLADSGVAVTVTFGTGRGANLTCPSERNAEEMVRKGIKRLNTTVYGNSVKRKGYSIGAVTSFEGAGRFERIHAHIAFEPPPDMSFTQFSRLVDRTFKRSKWIEQRPHIKECWSQDWINYTLKLGQEALKPSCCFKAKHPVA